MRLDKFYVSVAVITLLCALSFCDNADDDYEEDVEVDSESEQDDKGKEKKKVTETESYTPPTITLEHEESVFFVEPFAKRSEFESRWMTSEAKKDGVDADISKYDGEWSFEEPVTKLFTGDLGLVLKSKARHHAISAMLKRPFEFKDKPFVVQYEVKFQQAMECGGAYVKLLSNHDALNLKLFHDRSPYTIMFGPDKCGEDKKLHFIFRHKNPKTGEYEEKHAKKPTGNFQSVFDGKKTHLFTLVVRPDNTFEVFVDQSSVNSGSLLDDFTPAVNPPKEIDDPSDKKPEDWDEREKIPDPDAEKPDDWDEDAPAKIPDADAKKPDDWLDDEPEFVPDPNGVKPDDWDPEEDGEWEAPQIANPKCEKVGCGEWKPPVIDNPAYKGKWSAPLIDNPNYKGIWKPRKIANPDYFEDKEPFKMTPIAAVGLELWSMTSEILFDNFIVTNDKYVADKFAADSWVKKNVKETYGGDDEGGIVSNLLEATSERPWLWVLFVIVVILPFVLIAACCFPGSKNDSAAKKKKTDEPTEDVIPEEDKTEETKEEETPAEGGEEEKERNEDEEKEAEGKVEEPVGKDEVDEEDNSGSGMRTRGKARKE
ncbi:calnexin-like [Montipora foliosa]|uniref:calnexin-like n=1 Tax=Montipora foliosa TaxID=591990 RepID=UPI0035F1AD10